MEQSFYIYNYLQSDYFLKNGLVPIECGKGKKNDIYLKFIRDKESEEVFYKWKKMKYGEETNPPKEF